jgi:hypothetical protein
MKTLYFETSIIIIFYCYSFLVIYFSFETRIILIKEALFHLLKIGLKFDENKSKFI